MTTSTLRRLADPSPAVDTPTGPVSPMPVGADRVEGGGSPSGLPAPSTLLANVVEWDLVALLPWRESFDMAPLPAVVPVVERRRRVDTRTLAEVVREVAG